MSATLHALPTADLATRMQIEAARDLMTEQAADNRHLRLHLTLRAFAAPRRCVDCHRTFAIHRLRNCGTGHDPIWRCGMCRMVEGLR